MSSASHALDPVETAKDDVDRSKRLIAQTLDDLTLHHSWLETYHREERRRAERLRRQEALERLELRRQRAAFLSRRFAVRAYVSARAATAYLAASGAAVLTATGTFLLWAAPRANRLARQTLAGLANASSSSASWGWDGLHVLSARSYALLQKGFLWSVRASETAGIVFRRKVWRFALIPAALAAQQAAHITAPARRRAGILWTRAWIKTQAQAVRLQRRLGAMWTGSSIPADWTAKARHYARLWTRMGVKTQARLSRRAAFLKAAAIESSRDAARSGLAHHAAAGLARTRMVTRSLLRRLKAQTLWTARAIKVGWKKQARLASAQLARTRHSAAVLERRAAEHVIRSVPRIRHFLAQHTPARTGSSRKTRALIVRPNTALAHIAPDHNFAPAPRSA